PTLPQTAARDPRRVPLPPFALGGVATSTHNVAPGYRTAPPLPPAAAPRAPVALAPIPPPPEPPARRGCRLRPPFSVHDPTPRPRDLDHAPQRPQSPSPAPRPSPERQALDEDGPRARVNAVAKRQARQVAQ